MQFENVEVSRYEGKIIGYLLKDRANVKESLKCGMKPIWFHNDELREFFKQIERTYENYGVELSKRLYMEEVRANPDIDVKDYTSYGKFYDWAYDQYDNEDNFTYYLSKVREDGIKLEVTKEFKNYVDNFSSTGGKSSLETLKRKLNFISYDQGDREVKILDYVEDWEEQIRDIQNRKEHPEDYAGLKTGFLLLDEHFNGFERGTINLIIGLTGTGKSTIVSNMAYNQCFNMNKKVLLFSLEDSALIWTHKITASETGVSLTKIMGNHGGVSEEELNKIKNLKKGREIKGKYEILQMPPRKYTVSDIDDEIERRIVEGKKWHPDVIYVDQLSLVCPTEKRGNRYDIEFGDVTKGFVAVAKKYNVPIIITGQANRASIRNIRQERMVDIQLENIAQSNQPSEDARSVLAIESVNDGDEDLEYKDYKIKILKQNYGQVNQEIFIKFKKSLLRFMDLEDEFGEGKNNSDSIVPDIDPFMSEENSKALDKVLNENFGKELPEIKQFDDDFGISEPIERYLEEDISKV